MEPHLGYCNFTINYIFIHLSTKNVYRIEIRKMKLIKKEKRLYSLLHFINYRSSLLVSFLSFRVDPLIPVYAFTHIHIHYRLGLPIRENLCFFFLSLGHLT